MTLYNNNLSVCLLENNIEMFKFKYCSWKHNMKFVPPPFQPYHHAWWMQSTQAIRKPHTATSFLWFRHQSSVRRCADFTLSTERLVLDRKSESLDFSPSRVLYHLCILEENIYAICYFPYDLGRDKKSLPSSIKKPDRSFLVPSSLAMLYNLPVFECEKNRSLRHL